MEPEMIVRMSPFMTTEHFTLESSRNGTISEANGRLSGYLSVVASGIVALAFVSQFTEVAGLFVQFASVLFPILITLGVMAFLRLVQLGMDHTLLTQGINRIRHFYLDMAPEAKNYLSFSPYDDFDGIASSTMLTETPAFVRPFTTAAAQVVAVNSLLIGVFAVLLFIRFFDLDVGNARLVGGVVVWIAVFAHYRYYVVMARRIQKKMEFRFPSPAASSAGGQ